MSILAEEGQRYAMIQQLSVQFPIKECCVALGVSRSDYYQPALKEQWVRTRANAELSDQIQRVFEELKGSWGSPRIFWVDLSAAASIGPGL